MGDNTKIQWSEATWNPTTGCNKVSPGCDACYAMTMAARLKAMGSAKYQNDGDPRTSGPGFALTVHPDTFDQPLRWKRPRLIFVNSMSDLFHEDVPFETIDQIFNVMRDAHWHTFQVLTKRPKRMQAWAEQYYDCDHGGAPVGECSWCRPLANVWLGTSIENDRYVFRANFLRETRAAVKFLSVEPLLGPVPSLDLAGLDWVIVGAESGKGARLMEEEWVRAVRDKCVDSGVAFFYKQKAVDGKKIGTPELDGKRWVEMPSIS